MQGYSDYIYEDGTDWLLRETWHAITSTNVFDLVRYWYVNGRPSRVEVAIVSADLQTLTSYSTYYIQYNWHGDAVTYVALDGSGAGNATSPYDPWGNTVLNSQYYQWNGGWGYLSFSYLGESYDGGHQGLYYVHGRWYSPDTGMFLSPNEKGDYIYGGDGPDAVNLNWVARDFLAGVLYQAARNNIDTLALALYLAPPSRKAYEEIGQSIESSMPDTLPFRVGRVFGSTVTIYQGITEINLAPTIGGGGTLLSCLTTGAETLGAGCVGGGAVSVAAGGAVLVHGLAVTSVSLANGYQNVMSLMSGSRDRGNDLQTIWNDRGLFLNWLKGSRSETRIGNPVSDEEARAIIANAQRLGLQVDLNPDGLLGLEKSPQWGKIPHFKVENIHIPVRLGFKP